MQAVGEDRDETAGAVFAEALRRWREAISHDPAASASEAPQRGAQAGAESPLDAEDDESGSGGEAA
jgi:hypothetical protein